MRLIALLLLALSLRAADVQRIISTSPSITETLFAMGLGPRVVGVTVYCKYPPQVLSLPKIGTFLQPDVEAIVALHPDLVVVQKQPNRLGEELARVHVRYLEVESENLSAIFAGAREIGKATNSEALSEDFVRHSERQLAEIQNITRTLHKPSVAFIVGHDPGSLQGLIAGAGKSYFSDLLNYAGATNAFADAATAYPKVSLEEIILRNPDAIIELSGDMSLWHAWPMLKAVKGGHVYSVPSDPFVVPGPRAPDAVKLLVHLLHPEVQP
jgi:iron complex transport system substrate-binding protein